VLQRRLLLQSQNSYLNVLVSALYTWTGPITNLMTVTLPCRRGKCAGHSARGYRETGGIHRIALSRYRSLPSTSRITKYLDYLD